MNINRIVIIGISGTGKTTIARIVSNILEIPIIHYDKFVRDKNRTEVNEKIVEKKLEHAMKEKKWIMEWYIHPAAKSRLEKADKILYLDYSWYNAMFGGIKRRRQHRGSTRAEMAEGCIEKLDVKYLKVMRTREERQEIEDAIIGFENKVIRLKTKKETRNWIKEIEKNKKKI